MLLRREFFSSIASCLVIATPAVALAKRSFSVHLDDLQWKSFAIGTLPNNDAYRSPVITHVSMQPIGNLIAVVGDDHVVSIYDHQQQAFIEHVKRHKDWVRGCSFSPDGELLATSGNDRALFLWRVGNWVDPQLIKRSRDAIFDIAFSPDGKWIGMVGFCDKLALYDVNTGQLIEELKCPCADMHALAFSPDGKFLAAGGRCGTVRVWNTSDLQQAAQYRVHNQRIRSIEFSSANDIVSAGDDQFVKITDPMNPQTGRALPRHTSKLYATAIMDEQLLATAGSDNLIHVWNMGSMQLLGSMKGHTGTVTSLAYAQRTLVSGSYDTYVRIWNIAQLGKLEQRTTDRTNGWNPAYK
jgi:WD40 repeat protein